MKTVFVWRTRRVGTLALAVLVVHVHKASVAGEQELAVRRIDDGVRSSVLVYLAAETALESARPRADEADPFAHRAPRGVVGRVLGERLETAGQPVHVAEDHLPARIWPFGLQLYVGRAEIDVLRPDQAVARVQQLHVGAERARRAVVVVDEPEAQVSQRDGRHARGLEPHGGDARARAQGRGRLVLGGGRVLGRGHVDAVLAAVAAIAPERGGRGQVTGLLGAAVGGGRRELVPAHRIGRRPRRRLAVRPQSHLDLAAAGQRRRPALAKVGRDGREPRPVHVVERVRPHGGPLRQQQQRQQYQPCRPREARTVNAAAPFRRLRPRRRHPDPLTNARCHHS